MSEIRKSGFTLYFFSPDGITDPETAIVGYTTGDTWNGWSCPAFPLESVIALSKRFDESNAREIAAGNTDSITRIVYDPETAKVTVHQVQLPDDPSVYEPRRIVHEGQEIAVYDIGSHEWVWEEVALTRDAQCREGRDREFGPESLDGQECIRPAQGDGDKCQRHSNRDQALQQIFGM